MLTIGNKHLRKRYVYPNNITDVYLGQTHIWPYITNTVVGEWQISLSASPTSIGSEGGTVNITANATRTVTSVWVNYNGTTSEYYKTYTTETKPVTLTTSVGTISGNTVNIPENTDDQSRQITITATIDGVSKQVVITQDAAFSAHYWFAIGLSDQEEFGESVTLDYPLTPETTSSPQYSIKMRSRYYTSETEYTGIPYTASSNVSWIKVTQPADRNGFGWELQDNDTGKDRSGTITLVQDETNDKVYVYINQGIRNNWTSHYHAYNPNDNDADDDAATITSSGGTIYLVGGVYHTDVNSMLYPDDITWSVTNGATFSKTTTPNDGNNDSINDPTYRTELTIPQNDTSSEKTYTVTLTCGWIKNSKLKIVQSA